MKDRLEAFLGAVLARTSSSEMLIEKGKLTVRPLAPAGLPSKRAPLLEKLGEPLLEVNNDQFPTGIFQRRIVEVLEFRYALSGAGRRHVTDASRPSTLTK